MISATLVIPTYNRAKLLGDAIGSISELHLPGGIRVELLVIDNGSTDATAAVIRAQGSDFPIPIRAVREVKQGLNHARNRAIMESTSDWLVYLDDDMRIGSEWLLGLADAAKFHRADAVTGPVYPHFEEAPAPWHSRAMLNSVNSIYSQKGSESFILPPGRRHELPGCNFAVKRELAAAIGGFHPQLDRSGQGMLAGGDTEFGLRLSAQDAAVVYDPRCRIEHLISAAKISREGLLRRWEGLGATARAIECLQGRPYYELTPVRAILRWLRVSFRARIDEIVGREQSAFESRLIAAHALGYLLRCPKNLQRITGPYVSQPRSRDCVSTAQQHSSAEGNVAP